MRILQYRDGNENEPAIWDNEQFTPEGRKRNKAEKCPIIEDFEIAFIDIKFDDFLDEEPDENPYSLYFFSQERGLISGPLLDWDMKDLRKENFEIPFNWCDSDMDDFIISSNRKFVFILEGRYRKPEYFATPWSYAPWERVPLGKYLKALHFPVFHKHRSYKIYKERYIAEWKLAIEASKGFS